MLALDELKQFKKYDKMKDSGVEWLGEIPEHWKVLKIKYCGYVGTGSTPSNVEYSEKKSKSIPFFKPEDLNSGKTIESTNDYLDNKYINQIRILPKYSILVVCIGATIGKVGMNQVEGSTNQQINYIEPNDNFDNDFIYYILSTKIFQSYLKSGSTSTTLPIINRTNFSNLYIPYTSKKYQSEISKFLNQEVSKLDQFISKKQRLIDLLQEKRQALITQAVTKGLDPSVPMKDSGVEWLGEIPEHWESISLKHLGPKGKYSLVDGPFGSDLKSDEYQDEGIRIIQLQNIGQGFFIDDVRKFITEKKYQELYRHNTFPNDIVIAKMASPVARSCIVPEIHDRYLVVADCVRLRLDHEYTDKRFVNYFMNTSFMNQYAENQATGTTRQRINLSTARNLPIVLPSKQEQIIISDFLDKETSKLDQLISKIGNQIELIKEYRQALITNAVTGKIDVRGEVE